MHFNFKSSKSCCSSSACVLSVRGSIRHIESRSECLSKEKLWTAQNDIMSVMLIQWWSGETSLSSRETTRNQDGIAHGFLDELIISLTPSSFMWLKRDACGQRSWWKQISPERRWMKMDFRCVRAHTAAQSNSKININLFVYSQIA